MESGYYYLLAFLIALVGTVFGIWKARPTASSPGWNVKIVLMVIMPALLALMSLAALYGYYLWWLANEQQ